MTLMQLCALTPPFCRMAADPTVRRALSALSLDPEASRASLAAAMARHPDDARRALTLLGSGDPTTTDAISRRVPREALAFFHLCGQCTPEEILSVLTCCTVPVTAECLALLIGQRRREQALAQYAAQLLWRICGDDALPDAIALFGEPPSHRAACDVAADMLRRLKEVDA